MKAAYLLDCYTKEFSATVTKVTNDIFIELDSTFFYPTGGGQPHDTGKIVKDGEEFQVEFVKKIDKEISHQVSKKGLLVGDTIKGEIDWQRRYIHMRYHTAAHILSHIIGSETGARTTGNQLSEEKGRIDFNLEKYEKEKIKDYIEMANKVIEEGHEIELSILPREEAEIFLGEKMTSLAKGFSEEIKEVRVVNIKGFAKEACSGTHIKNTKEIGKLELVKVENKGKNNRRVTFKLISQN